MSSCGTPSLRCVSRRHLKVPSAKTVETVAFVLTGVSLTYRGQFVGRTANSGRGNGSEGEQRGRRGAPTRNKCSNGNGHNISLFCIADHIQRAMKSPPRTDRTLICIYAQFGAGPILCRAQWLYHYIITAVAIDCRHNAVQPNSMTTSEFHTYYHCRRCHCKYRPLWRSVASPISIQCV